MESRGPQKDADARETGAEPPALPHLRRPAAVLLGLEGLAMLGLATFAFAVIANVEGGGRFGTGLGVFLIVFAVSLFAAARSVLVRRRFGVGYGITWQLFQALVGASMISAGLVLQGAIAILAAIAVFVLLTQVVRKSPIPIPPEA